MRRTPTQTKILQGTFRKDRANPNEPTPEPPEDLKAPEWLDQYGRECWDHYVPKLVKAGILTCLDVYPFAAACERWSVFRRSMEGYKEGLVHETESNGQCSRPELATAKAAYDQFCKLMGDFGCLPVAQQSQSSANR